MSKKERLKKSIDINKAKVAELKERIKIDEEELERVEAFELKMMANVINANGLDTFEILKAIQQNDFHTIEQLMKSQSNSH